jgi:hypothetical protein
MYDLQGSNAMHLVSVLTDAGSDQDEFGFLRALNQELTSELFQTCCELQREPSCLNPLELSALVYTLQIISGRLRQLENWSQSPS